MAPSLVRQTNDFVILGPSMVRGNRVAEAIASLYYLPRRYKLVLPITAEDDDTFRQEMLNLVKRMALSRRVHFGEFDIPEADAVLVTAATPTDMRDMRIVVAPETPEGLASAILNTARGLVAVAA
ncbi:MAG TPA: hypothetical protein VLH84_02200 [Patescibacteria group bacterium]|nr:hypothetical protein [Patescibacteria group bacterium]